MEIGIVVGKGAERKGASVQAQKSEDLNRLLLGYSKGKRRTYAARSIHLHCVQNLLGVSFNGSIRGVLQNLIVTRGSKTEASVSEHSELETPSILEACSSGC